MSARNNNSTFKADTVDPTSAIEAGAAELQLAEGNGFSVASPDNPLRRNLVVSIRASLNELCLQSSKGTWSPSSEALKAMFQQRKFTDLNGSADAQGDLKSIVLHEMNVDHVASTFPISLGAKITGVDDCTFSSTGNAYSMIVLPKSANSQTRKLQSDDVSLAYEFSKKFPGYTSENLAEKGIHEVSQRRFVLVAADHPLVSAISDNADKLQMGEISMMPEGLVKISQGLYESILPLVKTQVESQIKVRDFSRATVSVQPAEHASWSEARSAMVVESKRKLKVQREAAMAAAPTSEAQAAIKKDFETQEAAIERDIDHTPYDLHVSLGVAYNFLSR